MNAPPNKFLPSPSCGLQFIRTRSPRDTAPTSHRYIRDALKPHERTARACLIRQGFRDLVDDALQETYEHFLRKAKEPTFALPDHPKAWLLRWSHCCAHVLRRQGKRLDPVAFDRALDAQVLAWAQLVAEDHATPETPMLAREDEEAFAVFQAQLRPLDHETFLAEVQHAEQGVSGTPRHRKRLERARRRALPLFERYGFR